MGCVIVDMILRSVCDILRQIKGFTNVSDSIGIHVLAGSTVTATDLNAGVSDSGSILRSTKTFASG